MQDLISQVEDLAGIEIDHTTSMVMIFGIIFLTAVVVHIILHWVVLRTFEKRAIASSRLWLQIITQNKLFHRLAFLPCRGLSSIFRRYSGCKKAPKRQIF